MRVLVSGASGFIGGALSAHLRALGHDVYPIVRRLPRPGEAGLDLAARRLETGTLPGAGLEGVDAVFHLAGEPLTPRRWGPAKRERIRSSRITSTDVLARALAGHAPPGVLVVASAVGYYGERGEEVLDEDSPAGEGFLPEVCRSWEAASTPAEACGWRVVRARSGVVLGPGGMLGALLPLFRLGLGARIANGRQWMSWIGLSDEVGALVHLAEDPEARGSYNLCAPEPVRNAEFTAALAAVVGRRARLSVPRPALRALAGATVTDEFIAASTRALPRRLSDEGFSFRHRGLEGALSVVVNP